MKVHSKPNKKAFTTIYGSDPNKKILSLIDEKDKYLDYRKKFDEANNLKESFEWPIQIDFELNYSCNFSCTMCTWSVENNKNKGKTTWFDFDNYKDIIDEGTKNGLKSVRLNYINEPLIRKDIIKFIDYAKQKGILDIYFSTNASLLNDKLSLELMDSGLTRIQFSIDAYTKKTFDQIRQGGNFKQVVENIKRFLYLKKKYKKNLPITRVNFVITETNKNELDDFLLLWKDKVDNIGVQNLVDINNILKKNKTKKITKKEFYCSQPYYHLTIRYDGSVLPCCSFYGAKLPIAKFKARKKLSNTENLNYKEDNKNLENLKKEMTIKEIWDSKDMQNLRKIHKNGDYHKNEICKDCVHSSSHLEF